MKKYGLIGKSLTHSRSPELHGFIGDYNYDLIETDDIKEAVYRDYDGFNVTVPYKKTVMEYLDELSDDALQAGSVNTVKKLKNGKLKGYNTDIDGFIYLLKYHKVKVTDKKIVVFGSGGVSGAVQTALKRIHAGNIVIVSRSGLNNYDNLRQHSDADILINATPLGMYPQNGESPLDQSGLRIQDFPNLKIVLDVIYNPTKTKLLLDAEKSGIKAISGMMMLTAQGAYSSEIWNGAKISDKVIISTYRELIGDQQNIVIIGMPGSGKSSLSRLLAKKMKRPFVDTDREIEKEEGISISSMFADEKLGEKHMRKSETQVLERVCKESGQVIATGGGSIVRWENRDLLRQNSIVIYIKRPVKQLVKKGRPLSKEKGVENLYRQRAGIYDALADISIINAGKFGSRKGKSGEENSFRKDMNIFVHRIKVEVKKYYNNI